MDPHYKPKRQPSPDPPPYVPVETDEAEAALYEQAQALEAAKETP